MPSTIYVNAGDRMNWNNRNAKLKSSTIKTYETQNNVGNGNP